MATRRLRSALCGRSQRACGACWRIAQTPPAAPRPAPCRAAARHATVGAPATPASREVPLDRVVAVVNDEALTQYEVERADAHRAAQMPRRNVTPPAPDVLDKQVLERLITERALLQFAKETGVRVDDTDGRAHDPAHRAGEQAHARRVPQGARPREASRTRSTARTSAARSRIQRLREREVDSRVGCRDAEVDNYLATVAAQAGGENEYLLVAHPRHGARAGDARPDRRAAAARRGGAAAGQGRQGVRAGRGGVLRRAGRDRRAATSAGARRRGCRRCSSRPCAAMKKGDVSPVLRSPAGFHIVKLIDVAQPQRADGRRPDARAAHPGPRQRE